MSISDEEATRLAIIFAQVLQQSRSVSDTEHFNHHRWIAVQIQREEAWRDFWRDMRVYLAKRGMIGVILGLGAALILALKIAIKAIANGG